MYLERAQRVLNIIMKVWHHQATIAEQKMDESANQSRESIRASCCG